MDSLAHKPTPMAGALLLVFGIGFAVHTMNQRPGLSSEPLAGDRAEERHQARIEVEEQGHQTLNAYAVIDAENGVYQLPIERSIGLLVREWRNDSGSGRDAFLARATRVHGELDASSATPGAQNAESTPINQFE